MAAYVGALDQGTTSTRFMVFDRGGRVVAAAPGVLRSLRAALAPGRPRRHRPLRHEGPSRPGPLEATAWQTKEVVEAMEADAGIALPALKVDGGMVANDLLMQQFQADVLGIPVIRPAVPETTSLGAACAAGLPVGFWRGTDEMRANWRPAREWRPGMGDEDRARGYRLWRKAVARTLDWVEQPALPPTVG